MPTACHPPLTPCTLPEIFLCPTPQTPCCPQAGFKSFHTLLTPPHGPSHTIRADPTVGCCHAVPLQSHALLPFHDLPPRATVPPPPLSPSGRRAVGGRKRRQWIQQTRPFKKQDETGAAAGAVLLQARAAPARPREGQAGPGPARWSSRNGSRHRHSARQAQAWESHGVLHHGLKLERKHTAVSPCLQCSQSPHHCPGTRDGG